MKQCPQCGRLYTDDLSFCLSDGTALEAHLDQLDEPTVIRSRRTETADRPAATSRLWLKILAAAIVLMVGTLVFGGIIFWMFWPRDVAVVPGKGNDSDVSTPTPTQTTTPRPTATRILDANSDLSNLRSQQEELERERKRLEEERRRLQEEKSPRPGMADRKRFIDPGTSRISFRRNSTGETISGTIGRRRKFVLRTLDGQYLSASVRSPESCVTFTDGAYSTGYRTRSANSYLYITNQCNEPAQFSLTVTVR